MKYVFFYMALLSQLVCFCQDPGGPDEVTAAMEKKFYREIEAESGKLKQEMKKNQYSDLDIEFTIDTFKVEAFMNKYMAVDYSTVGMRAAGSEATQKYDSLLNKYYKKLLAVLKAKDKQALIQAQKAWISFRNLESKLIQTISKEEYSGGGTVQLLIDTSMYLDLVRNRTVALFNHLSRATGDY